MQERLASGKRINRPSDDPAGAEAVINLKTSIEQIEQFQRSATAAGQRLTAADDTLSGYEHILERIRVLVSQGLSDTTTQESRDIIATEVETLRGRILDLANSKYGDDYLFGGTRQGSPPFDPNTGVPSAIPSNAQYLQIEPGANAIAVGITGESFLTDSTSDIFTDLDSALAALRGTGNPTADHTTLQNTFSRLDVYSDLVGNAHARVGANLNITEFSQERLNTDHLSLEERSAEIEGADFADTAIELTQQQQALDATLQVVARGRRSLFDFLG